MNRPNFILSPCGTSLLTYGVDQELRKIINNYSNTVHEHEVKAASPNDYQQICDHLKRVEQKIQGADIASAKKFSAELNGIISYYQEVLDSRKGDFHQLLCTDTWLGEESAKLIRLWLDQKGLTIDVHRPSDLRTKDVYSFQVALSDMVQWCDEVIRGYRKSHYVVFNLTGGFKSIQGFMQIMAQFYADEAVYIFETGGELLRLPRLPLKMDAQETVKEHLEAFRRLALGLAVPQEQLGKIPETMLLTIDGRTGLSPWGGLVWKQTRDEVYSTDIFPPPGKVLKYGPGFESSVADLPPDRKKLVNQRIDDLVKHLEESLSGIGSPYNPASLDFKPLKGNPMPPSTHECDAWSDRDARRIFGHFEDKVFILNQLNKGLH